MNLRDTLLSLAFGFLATGHVTAQATPLSPPPETLRPQEVGILSLEGPWLTGEQGSSHCLSGLAGEPLEALAQTPPISLEAGAFLTFSFIAPIPAGLEFAVEARDAGEVSWEILASSSSIEERDDKGILLPGPIFLDLSSRAGRTVEIRWHAMGLPAADATILCIGEIEIWGITAGTPFGQKVAADAAGPDADRATALSENFSGGIPASWTVVHSGDCTYPPSGAPGTWTTSNPGGRTATSPIVPPFAIVDSDWAGSSNGVCAMDEQLVTPVLNLSSASTVTLRYDHYFRYASSFASEIGDVDARSSKTGGAWVNVRRYQGASSPNPQSVSADITSQAAGAADVQVRFHYYNALWEWYWMVDNVGVDYVACPLPGAPSGVSATTTSCNNVTVSWTGGSGATSHNLIRTSGACPSSSSQVTFTGVSSPYSDTTAAAGSSYCYVVQAANACGTANSASVTGTRLAKPGAPAAPSLSPGCTSMNLTWSAVAMATSYDVWRASGSGCAGPVKVNASPVAGTSYLDSGLPTGATFSYFLTASNACGTSGNGSCASAATLSCSPNLVFSSVGTWTQVAGDGDGSVEPGERWSVPVTIRNAGTLQATLASASLSANGVQVCNNPGSFGTLAPGATATASFLIAISTTFATDYGCGAAASFSLTGKSCAEATPAGANEAGVFSRAVGQMIQTPYTQQVTGPTGGIPRNTTTNFTAAPVSSMPDPLTACTADISLTPPCNGTGNLSVRIEHDPGSDGTFEYVQIVYSGAGSGWSNLTGVALGTMVDGTDPGNGVWRLSVRHSLGGTCTPSGALLSWTLHLQAQVTTWDCSSIGPGGCGAGPKPVPDGRWVPGVPLKAARLASDGSTVSVTWDSAACPAPAYALYSGPLSAVASYGYDNWANCSLGTSGSATAALNAGAVFFVVVPLSGAVEGSHGRTSSGAERPATGASHCGVTSKDASGTCP